MTLTFDSILFIAFGSAFGFWVLMMTAPFRRTLLQWSWFIDIGVTYILIQIFHQSTAGMAMAMLGGFFFSAMRWLTCKTMKIKDVFTITSDWFKSLVPKRKKS